MAHAREEPNGVNDTGLSPNERKQSTVYMTKREHKAYYIQDIGSKQGEPQAQDETPRELEGDGQKQRARPRIKRDDGENGVIEQRDSTLADGGAVPAVR
ncbi:hypothetical protein F503_06500 [Ophiostoma piceae UAMH 11346]|uniref:Uncharacterized protein n=1 Tax=Ophiostoma piceae (strain UAMH 11346) TaxID=1262450 RepID=S3BRA3_OPHP1|nr:hypothetical protein F503_06500 [Ophiostoma piceae UAMH 11346]